MSDRVSTRRVYSGRVVNLDIDSVRFPDGRVGELEMIRHSGAAAIVPFAGEAPEEDPELLLVKQYRYAADGYLYEIPAGRLEPGEDPAACARRELEEETGFVASELRLLTTIFTTPGFTDERIHLFVASGLTAGVTAHEVDEFMSVEKVRLSAAVEMIHRGEITDGKTIVGILLARLSRAGAGGSTWGA
jgi:ADP-ribose pyrophosphatase